MPPAMTMSLKIRSGRAPLSSHRIGGVQHRAQDARQVGAVLDQHGPVHALGHDLQAAGVIAAHQPQAHDLIAGRPRDRVEQLQQSAVFGGLAAQA